MSQQSLGAAALVLNFVSGVASVVGIAIPYWHYTSINGQTVSSGLWQLCAKARGESACVSWVLGKPRCSQHLIRILNIMLGL